MWESSSRQRCGDRAEETVSGGPLLPPDILAGPVRLHYPGMGTGRAAPGDSGASAAISARTQVREIALIWTALCLPDCV